MSTELSTILLHGHPYSLKKRAPREAPLVETARAALLHDLTPDTLSADFNRATQILLTAQTAAHAANDENIETDVCNLSQTLATALGTAVQTLSAFHCDATTVLREQSHVYDTLRQRHAALATTELRNAHVAARHIAARAHQVTTSFCNVVRRIAAVIDGVHGTHAHHCTAARTASDALIDVRAKRSRAWLTHSVLLESQADAARHFCQISRDEREAARRACFALGFYRLVQGAHHLLNDNFDVAVLSGISQGLGDVVSQARVAQREKRSVSAQKVVLRRRDRLALQDVSECVRLIRLGEAEVERHHLKTRQLRECAVQLKKVSCVVMHIASFWAQLNEGMERLSCKQLINVIKMTCTNEDSQAVGQGQMDVAVNPSTAGWMPGVAVKRMLIEYYAGWAAIADVSEDCANHMNMNNLTFSNGNGGQCPSEASIREKNVRCKERP